MNHRGREDSDSSDSDGTDGSGDFHVGNEHAAQNELMARLISMRQSVRIAELRASHMNIRQVHNTYGSLHSVSSPDGMIHTYHNPVTNQNIVIRQPWLVQIAAQSDDGVTQSTEANRMVEAMQPSMPGSAREVFTQSSREVSEIIIRTETIAATSSQQVNPACVSHLVPHSPAICQQRNPACVSHLVTHPPRPRDGNTLSEIGRPAKMGARLFKEVQTEVEHLKSPPHAAWAFLGTAPGLYDSSSYQRANCGHFGSNQVSSKTRIRNFPRYEKLTPS